MFQWFFNVFLIFAVFNISLDLLWILEPTWLHFKLILEVLGVLGCSSGRPGRSWEVLGGSRGVLAAFLGGLGTSVGSLK